MPAHKDSKDLPIKLKKKGYKKYIVIGALVILIVIFFIVRSGKSASNIIQSATATTGNVVEKVSVTGQVSPINKADLSFETSGVITAINVKVGDTVKKGDVIATLDTASDKAALVSAQAKLADMTRSLRPQELAVDQSKVSSSQTTLANAIQDAFNASRQGFVYAQGAVNSADIFFTNPQSANPTINIFVQSPQTQITIDAEFLTAVSALAAWKADLTMQNQMDISSVSATTSAAILNRDLGYLNTLKTTLADVSTDVNGLTTGNSGLSQGTITSYVSTMNSSLSQLSQAVSTITGAQTELSNASTGLDASNNQFSLDVAGSSQDAILAQSAQVDIAKAELAKDSIIAPLAGIITTVTPNPGEFVPAGQVEFGIIDTSQYKIEAFVAEADIAKIIIGNSASVTLDAYGPNVIFPAHVIDIDPAETILQGVPTYKVTLTFDQADARIRSGMTANTDILTHEADNVITIPYRAVITANGSSTVRVINADGKTYASVPVTTGLKGSDGTIQILTGLADGQKVVVDLKQ